MPWLATLVWRSQDGITTSLIFTTRRYLLQVIFARGLLRHVCTRLYFEGVTANAADSVLLSVPPERRASLIAQRSTHPEAHCRFDIRLAGTGETVFFSY